MMSNSNQAALASDPSGRNFSRGFVSAQRLAELLFRGALHKDRGGRIVYKNRSFLLQAAVRVVRCRDAVDRFGLVGCIEARAQLQAAGATLQGACMTVDGTDYEVEMGVLAKPVLSPGKEASAA